jgi:DNA repair exonuclease SbcCD ATPase subunit
MTNQDMIEIQPVRKDAAHEYEVKSSEITGQIQTLKIIDQASYESAAGLLKTIKDMAKRLEEERKKITSPLDVAKKAVMDLFRSPSEKLSESESKLKSLMLDYQEVQDRIRREQEAKLQREAEKKQRELEDRAQKAEESGKTEKADELREKAAMTVAPTLAPNVQKVEGLSVRETWSAEVTDMTALVKAVAEGKAPMNFLTVNTTVLNAQARATKDSLSFPGVKFIATKGLASR